MTINDLVLIRKDNYSPLKRKLGRIIAVHPGSDTEVRVIIIKTVHGVIRRLIMKCVPLQ